MKMNDKKKRKKKCEKSIHRQQKQQFLLTVNLLQILWHVESEKPLIQFGECQKHKVSKGIYTSVQNLCKHFI